MRSSSIEMNTEVDAKEPDFYICPMFEVIVPFSFSNAHKCFTT